MPNEYVAPVDHGVLSATGTVATGAAGGALKSGAKAILYTTAAFAAVGVLIGTGGLAGILGLFSASAAATVGSTLAWTAGMGALGLVASAFTSIPAAIFGAGKGALNASERVSQEKGASQQLEAQVSAMQAQAVAMNHAVSANDNRYNFPARGTSMNQASSQIMADSAQNMGVVAGQQLQRA